ncbi:MAG: HAD-IA family hydrolase [Candidatus Latescibacteria bacterium]|nr:HAD-IA family hydrolase [Candidatus Latescibacterota bacterium]
MTAIRTILFDLDGTLLDRSSSLKVFLHRQIERLPQLLGPLPFADYMDRVVDLDAHGHGPKDQVWESVAAHFGLPPGTGALLLDDFFTFFPDTCVPFPKAHQTLAGLRQRGLRLGLVTNGRVNSQQPKIDGLGLGDYFDAVLISEAEGVSKPAAEIFLRALQRLDATAEETVMVGDNPSADIAGAQACGMKAIWKRDTYWEPPTAADGVVGELEELPGVIAGL